jgi:hypothetical protein
MFTGAISDPRCFINLRVNPSTAKTVRIYFRTKKKPLRLDIDPEIIASHNQKSLFYHHLKP